MSKAHTSAFKLNLALRKEFQKKLMALAAEYAEIHKDLRRSQEVIEEDTDDYNADHMMANFENTYEALDDLMEEL